MPVVLHRKVSTPTVAPRLYGAGTIAGISQQLVLLASSCNCFETRGRWGDFSGVAVDPVDQSKVWVGGELLQANNSWKTQISEIQQVGGGI